MPTPVDKLWDAKQSVRMQTASARTALSEIDDIVNGIGVDMYPRQRILSEYEYNLLMEAERPLYKDEYAMNSYTDVIPRDFSEFAALVWDHISDCMGPENMATFGDRKFKTEASKKTWIKKEEARWVARSLFMMIMGPEALIR